MENFEEFFSHLTLRHYINSAIFIFLMHLLREVLLRSLAKSKIRRESKRKWIRFTKRFVMLSTIICLLVVWSTELQTFAVSFIAVAAALIIASKEFILCFIGGFYRAINHPFRVGDRITVGEYRGDVIDTTLLSTKIMQIGPEDFIHQYTGHTISIPNSIFLGTAVTNETYMNKYVFHVFKMPIFDPDEWHEEERAILDAANDICSEYIDDAKAYMAEIADHQGLDIPPAEPRVLLHALEKGKMCFFVRIPAPAFEKGRVEQRITRRVYTKSTKSKKIETTENKKAII